MERKGPTPYLAWMQLPAISAIAVLSGIVRPVSCPDCGGSGRDRTEARALDVEKHLDPSQVLCPVCKDRGWVHKTLASVSTNLRHTPREEGFTVCTDCFRLSADEAKAQHAAVCGCTLSWIPYDPKYPNLES